MNIKSLPIVIQRKIPGAQLPVNYVAASKAIAECARIDECKDWSDKAAAIAVYAKQLGDDRMRNDAKRIELRAKVRIGELLLQIKSASGRKGRNRPNVVVETRGDAAKAAGLTPIQGYHYVAMAKVPHAHRERLINGKTPVKQARLIRIGAEVRHALKGRLIVGKSYLKVSPILSQFASFAKNNVATDLALDIGVDEAARLREQYLVVITDWLDTFEQHLPKAKRNAA